MNKHIMKKVMKCMRMTTSSSVVGVVVLISPPTPVAATVLAIALVLVLDPICAFCDKSFHDLPFYDLPFFNQTGPRHAIPRGVVTTLIMVMMLL